MPWRKWDTETTGTAGRVSGSDWNDARKFNTEWTDVTLSGTSITISGDGKYRVLYSGAQSLNTIIETGGDSGYIIYITADRTGAGGNLTINNGAGNIFCHQSINIVLSADNQWAQFAQRGSNFYGMKMYEP